MSYDDLLRILAGQKDTTIRQQEPLCNHSTWRIGGPADLLLEPGSLEQLARIIVFAKARDIPRIVIGKGSNLLFDDAGFRGVVIKIGRKLSRLAIDGTTVRAESGIAIPRLARATGLSGLTGIEHTIGIPGTLGGLIVMNGGSQHKAIGDVICSVEVMDHDGNTYRISKEKCGFSYRQSRFQNSDLIVVGAKMELQQGDPRLIRSEMLNILRNRRAKLPRTLPNCGSVFKSSLDMYNTVGPPGKLIEQAGLKGLRIGNAQVSRKHANFIINVGSATARDVLELVARICARVHGELGVRMKCEARYVDASAGVLNLDEAICHEVP